MCSDNVNNEYVCVWVNGVGVGKCICPYDHMMKKIVLIM